jgi:hypothetical protein
MPCKGLFGVEGEVQFVACRLRRRANGGAVQGFGTFRETATRSSIAMGPTDGTVHSSSREKSDDEQKATRPLRQ